TLCSLSDASRAGVADLRITGSSRPLLPGASLPHPHQVRRALSEAELIVVQDPYHPTETTHFADVLLPVAQWAEKTGTMTSSERLVSFSEQILKPPGVALPDWQILARFGQAMGFSRFQFEDSGTVWDEFIVLTAGQPCPGPASRPSWSGSSRRRSSRFTPTTRPRSAWSRGRRPS